MNRIFKTIPFFQGPDQTWVSPFLNSKDSMSDLPFDLVDGFSIAFGKIAARSNSQIHLHPQITQVTLVLEGRIDLKMQGPEDSDPYTICVERHQAGLSKPNEFFQLVNPYETEALVIYIVSPAYVFEMEGEEVIYDDSIVIGDDWELLKQRDFKAALVEKVRQSGSKRAESYQRLSAQKSS